MLACTTRILFNADDRIVRVDATDGDGVPLPGTELTEYVGSEALAGLYRELFAAVRNSRPRISLMARCDDPEVPGVIAIEITRYGDDGEVELRSSPVRRSEGGMSRRDPANDTVDEIVMVVCSWCNWVDDAGRWVKIETLVEGRGWLVSHTPRVRFTHGLCPSCAAGIHDAAFGKSGPLPPVDR